MALMDAKEYDPRPAERRRKIIATAVVAVSRHRSLSLPDPLQFREERHQQFLPGNRAKGF